MLLTFPSLILAHISPEPGRGVPQAAFSFSGMQQRPRESVLRVHLAVLPSFLRS